MKLSHLVILLIISIGPLHNVSKGFFVVWIAVFIAFSSGMLEKIDNPVKTTGVVIKTWKNTIGSKDMRGVVEYIVDNKTYNFEISGPAVYNNKKKCIQYSKDNPEMARPCPTIGMYLFTMTPLIWGLYIIYTDLFIH